MRLCKYFTYSGEAFIGNESLNGDRASYLQSIGYCPQFDSIIEVSLSCHVIVVVFMSCQGVDW